MQTSPVEVATRVVGALLGMAEKRRPAMALLSAAVRAVVEELDQDGQRDTRPAEGERRRRPDAVDRLRAAYDDLVILEVQAGEVALDLQGLLQRQLVGSLARPHGYTPWQAHVVLMRMGVRRSTLLLVLVAAERSLRPRLGPVTSDRLRREIRVVTRQEVAAQEERVTLSELLAGSEVWRRAC